MTTATLLGRSLWSETERPAAPNPPLEGELQIDVAVVGGGITGLTCALLLQREGRRVALLEADRLGAGTTGETSAQVTSVPELGYAELIRRVGRGSATALAAATRAALQTMESLQERSLIPSGWARVPAYVFTESGEEASQLESEAEAARELGIAATFSRRSPLPFPVSAVVLFPGQARFHPLDYLQGLAAQFRESGGRIFEGTRVTGFEEGDSVTVRTDRGTLSAGSLVLATHIPIGLNLVQVEVAPYRSYVVVLELRGPLPDALFWDTATPYHYFRRCDAGRPLLLLGGEDHKAGQDPDPVERYERLEKFARVRFNVRATICRWASQYYEPADGLPYVGRSPLARNIFIATGFSGNGLVTGTLAAQALTDLLQGRESEIARQVSATRLRPLTAAKKVVTENLHTALRFVGDRVARGDASIQDLGRGSGRIVEVDGRKLAVYRDQGGATHALSPVCTHMGCLVDWNVGEGTWDCPCHGGRFTATGDVRCGPPLEPLTTEYLDSE